MNGGKLVSSAIRIPRIVSLTDDAAQINIVAFVTDRSTALGEVSLPPDQPTVVPVSVEEVLTAYDGWGDDVVKLLSCITNPNKWFINIVYPPLETYVKGNIALTGDAVRRRSCAQVRLH